MQYIIYKATNTINGKVYVGMTIQSLTRRIYLHYWTANKRATCHFHKALLKYPKERWIWEIEEQGLAPDKQFIKTREKHFIKEHNSFVVGYNMTEGGEDFSDPEYQRALQRDRVRRGTHPFVGGKIQSLSGNKRAPYLRKQQLQRVVDGTHPFLLEENPQSRRKRLKLPHHNQSRPWLNTKCTPESKKAWAFADVLYEWYKANKHKSRGGSYKQMAKVFNLRTNLMVIYYKYFEKGWCPEQDSRWIEWSESYKTNHPTQTLECK